MVSAADSKNRYYLNVFWKFLSECIGESFEESKTTFFVIAYRDSMQSRTLPHK